MCIFPVIWEVMGGERKGVFPKVGSFVMLFDLETDYWFKCKVTMETANLVQVGNNGLLQSVQDLFD